LFHVTNNGYSSTSASKSVAELVFRPREKRFDKEKMELRDDVFDVFELRDGVLEAADGLVDDAEDDEAGEGFSNLLIAAGLYGEVLVCAGIVASSSISSSS
jgi:hypothetical protein